MQPTLLNAEQRLDVLEAIELGTGIETAARFAGCDAADITHTLDADLRFRRQYQRAEVQLEIECLRAVRMQGRNWRAAAWALERIYPDRYTPRKSNSGKSTSKQPMPPESQSPIDKSPVRPASATDESTHTVSSGSASSGPASASQSPKIEQSFKNPDRHEPVVSRPASKTPSSAPAKSPPEPRVRVPKSRRSPPANAAELQQRALDFIDRRIAQIRAEIGQPDSLDDLPLDTPDDNSHLAQRSIGGPLRSSILGELTDKSHAAASESAAPSPFDDELATVGAFSDSGQREHRSHLITVGPPSTGPP